MSGNIMKLNDSVVRWGFNSSEGVWDQPHIVNRHYFIMSPNFAEFLLENADTGNDVLAVLDDIVEVVETGGTDL